MKIHFTKCEGKVDWLECIRQDHSTTRCPMPKQGILPHDLVHYVVESSLELRHGFYGLIAAGVGFPKSAPPWNADEFEIDDLTEALQAESLVECFQAEMWNGFQPSENFLEILDIICQQRSVSRPAQATAENLHYVRSQLQHFTQTWEALPIGQTLYVDADWLELGAGIRAERQRQLG
ncbi:MAG: hypothetical protein SNJ57_15385 [Cyanobacteriota bacterium]